MIKLPQIIGHRGACAYAPENTLASIQSAADMGIEWVELDVKLTADDVPIIFHDDNLIRITDHDALVKDVPYSAIKELDAGSWFADSFVDEKIPMKMFWLHIPMSNFPKIPKTILRTAREH